MSDPAISEADGRVMLADVCEKDFGRLKNTIPYWEEMNDNQRSAITSFGYNLGLTSTVLLVLILLALVEIVLGAKSTEPLCSTSTPGRP